MAGPAVALRHDLDPDGVLITIDAKLYDPLNLTAGLALFPKGLARAAEIVGLARIDGALQGLCIHPGQHQDLARFRMGCYRRDQAFLVKARGKVDAAL